MIRYILLIFNILIFTPFFSLIIIFIGLFDKQKNYTSYFAKLWAKIILKFSLVNCTIKGIENIRISDKFVIISNHQSFIDILVTFSLLPLNISFFTKKELFYVPLFGWALYSAGMIPVDRYNKSKSKESVNLALKRINKMNLSILNYPEGTRTSFEGLKPFKKGGFILAIESNIPILPICIIYNKNNITNNVRIVVADSIETLNYNIEQRDDLISITRDTIIKSMNT